MEKEAFTKLLREHDWHYEYSDDRAAWSKGVLQSNMIKRAAAADPELQKLLDEYKQQRGV